ncbi:ACP S-malonyltransferase, partial [candidate division WOR-3 bacterium]|nr:ACP S-malonyltransferase [candidate division WOR-3 bacterium]
MIGFVFPGQASQYVGMAKDLYDGSEKAKYLFESSKKVLGFDIKDILFNGPEDVLKESKNTQVAILMHSIICFELLKEKGLNPDCVAGHSLGEYSALYAAGVFSFDDVLHIVRFRGELMSKAGKKSLGAMCAIIGLNTTAVKEIIDEIDNVIIANYNSPAQTVISGNEKAVEIASARALKAGAKRVIKLQVSGAFHSPLMQSAFEKFGKVLTKFKFNTPNIPVALNVTGALTRDVNQIEDALKKQIVSPVRWVECVTAMKEYGVSRFIEVGPGKV